MKLPTSSDPFVSLVDHAGPSIVRVDAPRQGGATGLLWSADGLVITAHHALRRDEPLSVTLGGEHEPRPARLLGRDSATDLAVLKLEPAPGSERTESKSESGPEPKSESGPEPKSESGPEPKSESGPEPEALPVPTWREAESVRVGELGLALARPGRTVRAAMSLVAVVGESLRTSAGRTLAPYVELDRTLPRGFCVAPLLDLQGQVLGLATAGLAPHATVLLTAQTVRPVVEAIVAHGRVPQAFLGVGVSPARLPTELRDQLGQGHALAVVGLAEGGPAASAGLLVGDLILAVGGAPVRSPRGLRARLADRVGQPVAIRLLRGGQTTELEITAGERR